ncbi:oxygenase MpaB family protein [Streptomyces gamaensis]|uniref:Oxygenase MpaB family protein n=1 Tax=Streptomyces gamaensis TaxID=1763542 RepID=A0ABW0YWU3_9ACTN
MNTDPRALPSPGDPAHEHEAHARYRALTHGPLASDLLLGLNLGFYRTFAVPSIARALAATGKMTEHPKERAKATGALMYALFDHGLDSPEGTRVITTLKTLHAGLPVGDEEFVYVLAAFCVTPLRWLDAHGARAATPAEKTAAHTFYRGLARRMDLSGVPGSYTEFAAWMDAYEERAFAPTPEGKALMAATANILTKRFPRPLAPLVRSGMHALFDPRILAAIGATPPPRPVRALVHTALRVRARRLRRHTTPS